MKKTMHCMRCGSAIELDYTSKWQKYQCAGCGIEFKYRYKKDGAWEFNYNRADLENLYVGDEELVDIAKKKETEDGAV